MIFGNFLFRNVLEKGEKIQHILHRHPVTLQKKLFKIIMIGILLPSFFFLFFPKPINYVFTAWMAIGILKTCYICADWYFDSWLITNKGIILNEWNGFFNREFSRVEYQTIEEVSYSVKGFLPTIMGYGSITISRFGSPHPTTMKNAVQPKKVSRIILSVQKAYVSEKSFRDHETLKSLISDMIQARVK